MRDSGTDDTGADSGTDDAGTDSGTFDGDRSTATGAGPRSFTATGAGPRPFTASVAGTGGEHGLPLLFDHEKLEVYAVAREFVRLATKILNRKMTRELHEQFDRASMSILFNIGEGAGKTSKPDKQRFYEIARGSTTEAATQLDLMQIRAIITTAEYNEARSLLLRVAQMLSRLCSNPRFTRSPAPRP